MRAHPCTCARPVRVSTCALARAAPPPAAARVRPRTPADTEAREARAHTRPGMGSAHGPRLRVGHSRACPHTTHPRGFGDCSAHGESKFCFLKTSGIFFFFMNTIDLQSTMRNPRTCGADCLCEHVVCICVHALGFACICVHVRGCVCEGTRENVYVQMYMCPECVYGGVRTCMCVHRYERVCVYCVYGVRISMCMRACEQVRAVCAHAHAHGDLRVHTSPLTSAPGLAAGSRPWWPLADAVSLP